MSFETEGFLSEEAADWMRSNVERHRGLFLHLEVVIRSSYKFLGLSKFNNRNKQHVFTSALFLRSLNSLQALYFLAQRGFVSDVQATARNLIEVQFRISAVTHDALTVNFLVLDQERRRRKKLMTFISGSIPVPADSKADDLQRRKDQFDQEIASIEQGIFKLRPDAKTDTGGHIILPNIRELAKIAKLESSYEMYYDLLCEAVHTSTSHLENTTTFDENYTVQGFQYKPTEQDLVMFSLMAVGFHINSIVFTASVLGTNVDSIVLPLRERHEEHLKAFSEGKM
jgi:hypothetical protein